MISSRSSGLMLWVHATALLLLAAPGHAQSVSTTSFNHFLTGFPLTGTHASVACASCHVNGRFKGMPTQCIGCHNTMTAPGEPQSHPMTTTRCESCHQTTTWRDFRFIDHVQAIGPCASCHNGKLALGKPNNHIVTSAPCGNCHFNTVSFAGATVPSNVPAPNVPPSTATKPPAVAAATAAAAANNPAPHTNTPASNSNKSVTPTPSSVGTPSARVKTSHAGITDGCASCHNGSAAPGRPTTHVVTGAPCESCHKSTATFAGARMNHAGLLANCASCHNGRTAPGKPTNHLIANSPCETCHKSTATFAGARVDHSRINATCVSCHNGTMAEGKTVGHFSTARSCETCHRTAIWTPVVYQHTSPAYVNHGPGVSCSNCHSSNAQMVPRKFPAFHPDCGSCHADKYRPTSHPKFQRPVTVYYTGAELRDCTGACHIYSDSMQRTILTRRSGVHRAVGGGW